MDEVLAAFRLCAEAVPPRLPPSPRLRRGWQSFDSFAQLSSPAAPQLTIHSALSQSERISRVAGRGRDTWHYGFALDGELPACVDPDSGGAINESDPSPCSFA